MVRIRATSCEPAQWYKNRKHHREIVNTTSRLYARARTSSRALPAYIVNLASESERVDALDLRAVEVIICMITRDFSVISMTSQASLSLSLSALPLTKSLTHNRPLYLCLGSQGGKLWVAMRLLGPIACRKVCRNTAESEITENDQSVVLNRQLPVSTVLQTIGLDAATSEWDRLASGAERAREIKEKNQLAIADAGAAAAAAQSEGETSSRRACGSRKADRGTQETWGEMERLLASSNVRMPAQKLRSRILSFENVKGNDD